MFTVSREDFGVRAIFCGRVEAAEMWKWARKTATLTFDAGTFGLLLDLRNAEPLRGEAHAELRDGRARLERQGLARSAVVLSDPASYAQYKAASRRNGLYATERYFAAAVMPDWERQARAWIEDAVDPDASS